MMFKFHLFHLVNKSLWPIYWSINLLSILLSLVLALKGIKINLYILNIIVINLIYCLYKWTLSTVNESNYNGDHTNKVQINLKLGVINFILSEIMLFIGLFWSYLHGYTSPTINLGCMFPGYGITYLNPLEIPLLNTLILLSAAILITITHHEISKLVKPNYYDNNTKIILSNRFYIKSISCIVLCDLLILVFLYLQYFEFLFAPFDISDSFFASTFFMTTSLHGLHVGFAGIWLTIVFIKFLYQHNSKTNHTNLINSIYYFHFTDIVWLILYGLYYCFTF